MLSRFALPSVLALTLVNPAIAGSGAERGRETVVRAPAAARSPDSAGLCGGKCRVQGCYVGVCDGSATSPPAPVAGQFKALVRITCDGSGTCTMTGFQNFNGLVVPLIDDITLAVADDCTGTFTFASTGSSHFIVISKGGDEVDSMAQTPAGFSVTCHATRQ